MRGSTRISTINGGDTVAARHRPPQALFGADSQPLAVPSINQTPSSGADLSSLRRAHLTGNPEL